jgi:hypothetical protein
MMQFALKAVIFVSAVIVGTALARFAARRLGRTAKPLQVVTECANVAAKIVLGPGVLVRHAASRCGGEVATDP